MVDFGLFANNFIKEISPSHEVLVKTCRLTSFFIIFLLILIFSVFFTESIYKNGFRCKSSSLILICILYYFVGISCVIIVFGFIIFFMTSIIGFLLYAVGVVCVRIYRRTEEQQEEFEDLQVIV